MHFLTRVKLRNYKSIAACDIVMQPLIFLVGRNGSGKSNFLDALRFVADSLNSSLDHALRERGGINEVRRRSSGHPTHFAVRLDFRLSNGADGHYAFKVGARPGGGFRIQAEECKFGALLAPQAHYRVSEGTIIEHSPSIVPPITDDRLYLGNMAGLPEFRPLYDALTHMGFYALNPDRIREPQSPDLGDILSRDGGNLASVMARIEKASSFGDHTKARIEEYLAKVVPGIMGVEHRTIGPKETIEFRQQMAGSKSPWRFYAASMSDGTLRALGILTALLQRSSGQNGATTLIGIEEPEVALHPAALGALLDGLREASERVQVICTSHSPDLLDNEAVSADSLIAVEAIDGVTRLAPVDAAGREMLRRRLYTAGELLRQDQLVPDPDVVKGVMHRQLDLFDEFPD